MSVHKGVKMTLSELVMQGVPSKLRGAVWETLAGNKLGVSRAQFEQVKAMNGWIVRKKSGLQTSAQWNHRVDREGKLLPDIDYVVSVLDT